MEGRHEEGRGKEVESSKGVQHLGCAEWGGLNGGRGC